MKLDLPGWLVVAVCFVVAVMAAMFVHGCSPAARQETAKSAECAAVRSFFDDAQTKLIESGACDNAKDVESCYAHIALREAFVESLKRSGCGSHVAPATSLLDPLNVPTRDAVALSENALGRAFGSLRTNAANVAGCELRALVAFASTRVRTTTANFVPSVQSGIADVKVHRVHALRPIATVQHLSAIGDGAVLQNPRDTVRERLVRSHAPETTVSKAIAVCGPQPTRPELRPVSGDRAALVDLPPKACDRFFVHREPSGEPNPGRVVAPRGSFVRLPQPLATASTEWV